MSLAVRNEPLDVVSLEEGVEVVADLHLDPSDPHSCEGFAAWVRGRPRLRRLIILGDLFDAWVGPAHARLEGARLVLDALKEFCLGGGDVDFLWGNRDFLLDERVVSEVGGRLHGDSLLAVDAAGRRTLFVHGDELCTMDHSYQRMRRVLRSRLVSGTLLRLPLFASLWLARRLRSKSKRAVGAKLPEEMAMQEDAVLSLCKEHSAQGLVCGHAHSWRDDEVGEGVRWVVLDAFGGAKDCLCVDQAGQLVGESSGFGAGGVA